MNRIKSLAASMASTEDYSRCDELLEEFHTACDPQANSCPDRNDQSFQLSIEEVRASVNAAEKLVFSNITLFDGLETITTRNPFVQSDFTDQVMAWYRSRRHGGGSTSIGGERLSPTCMEQWLVRNAIELHPNYSSFNQGFVQRMIDQCRQFMIAELNRIEAEWNGNVENGVLCQSVSYAAVNEFGFEFSRFYEGRNRATHPDRNPMERTPGVAVHDVDPTTFDALGLMVFPVAYNFEQTDHGVKHLLNGRAGYSNAPGLQNFPGESSPLVGTWQITIGGRVYSYQYTQDEGCLTSQRDPELASTAMNAADESLALLVGKLTSIGTIRRYAALVNDKSIPNASEQLPGTCCLDDPLDSDFLGYNVSKKCLLVVVVYFHLVVAVSPKPSPHLFLSPHVYSMTLIMRIWNVRIKDHIILE